MVFFHHCSSLLLLISILNLHLKISTPKNLSSSLTFTNENDWAKIFVLYFPQFHEDELNNRLWGKGFTDWDNVRQSPEKNRYDVPILHPRPSDIGYYNLVDPTIREHQGRLAQKYGIDGFIYHHYWFYDPKETNIARISRSLEAMLTDSHPNLTFALHWASDNWIGSWSARGKAGELLIEQYFPSHNQTAIQEHYQYLQKFFKHSNYFKIHGTPVFFVYPRIKKPLSMILMKLASFARNDGYPDPGIHFIGSVNTMSNHELYTGKLSFSFQHPGLQGELFYPFATFPQHQSRIPDYCLNHYHQNNDPKTNSPSSDPFATLHSHPDKHRLHYVSTMTTFDNTPRRLVADAEIWNRSFPPFHHPYRSFAYDLKNILFYEKCCQAQATRNKGGKFVVINAWNEWAEGMAIEPSEEHGEEWLKSIQQVKIYLQDKTCQQFHEIEEHFIKEN